MGLLESSFWLVLTGGVLRHPSPIFRNALIERVRESAPGVQPIQSRFEPAAGALLLSLDLAHIDTDAPVLEQLEKSLPGAPFFAT